MKRSFAAVAFLWALASSLPLPVHGADDSEETSLIGILQSDHSLQEKDAACARLKRIGTARSVPALAALLTDDQLSHSARYALESMPGVEVSKALFFALEKTSASNQVGIINSLAMRHETAATAPLAKLLSSSDSAVAVAASEALGRIGGPQAIDSLEAAVFRRTGFVHEANIDASLDGVAPTASSGSTGPVHRAQIDALLACANQFLTDGDLAGASQIFRQIYDREKSDEARLAAFRGRILASGEEGITMMTDAIAGTDAPRQAAALQLAVRAKSPAATRALADLLSKVPAPVQIALLQCLAQRGDSSAIEPVARLADSQNDDVRTAAITALGDLGDGSVALLLARRAAATTGAERNVARQSLLDLRQGPVTAALLDALANAAPEVQLEVIGALGNRGDQSATPKMLELARSQTDSIRSAAFQGLASLAGPAQIPELVQLVINEPTADARAQAADTLASVCQRNQFKLSASDVQPLVKAVQTAPLEARLALLPVCGALTGESARAALRAAMEDPEAQVREAALRALCDTRDPDLLPDLVKVARASQDKKSRLLAIRGCVRFATQEEGVKLSNAQKLDAFKMIIDTPLDAQEKRLVLSALGALADEQALPLATAMLEDPEVPLEAAQAVIHIAGSISLEHPAQAGAALKKVLALTTINPATRRSAESAFKKIQ